MGGFNFGINRKRRDYFGDTDDKNWGNWGWVDTGRKVETPILLTVVDILKNIGVGDRIDMAIVPQQSPKGDGYDAGQ